MTTTLATIGIVTTIACIVAVAHPATAVLIAAFGNLAAVATRR